MARTERIHVRSREDVSDMPDWMKEKHCPNKKKYMSGKRIQPENLTGREDLTYIIDEIFLAYNSARLKECCQLFAGRMLDPDVTIGMSISGALTPAGLGCSCIIPMIKAGFIDWIVSTGANMVDQDFFEALGFKHYIAEEYLKAGMNDGELREHAIDRIYDTLIDEEELRVCDETTQKIIDGMEPGSDAEAIVAAVIAMSHALGKSVIAEGVETEEQAAVLRRLRCDEIQGYLVSAALPPEQFAEFLRRSAQASPPREPALHG